MVMLWLGVLLFAAPHVLSMLLPSLREGIRERLGEGQFKGLYSLVSLAGIVLLVFGYSAAMAGPDATALYYEPWAGARHVTMLLVLLAFILIAASHGKGYIKSFVRQPMSIGFALWSGGHLLANGEKPVVVIFALFFAIAVLDIILSTVRGKGPIHQPQLRSDISAAIAGMVLYVIFLFGFHPYILGVPVAG